MSLKALAHAVLSRNNSDRATPETPATRGSNSRDDLGGLRSDFITVRAWFVCCGEWTEAEALEVWGAIDGADHGERAFWAEWMAGMAQMVRDHAAWLKEIDASALEAARKRHGVQTTALDLKKEHGNDQA